MTPMLCATRSCSSRAMRARSGHRPDRLLGLSRSATSARSRNAMAAACAAASSDRTPRPSRMNHAGTTSSHGAPSRSRGTSTRSAWSRTAAARRTWRAARRARRRRRARSGRRRTADPDRPRARAAPTRPRPRQEHGGRVAAAPQQRHRAGQGQDDVDGRPPSGAGLHVQTCTAAVAASVSTTRRSSSSHGGRGTWIEGSDSAARRTSPFRLTRRARRPPRGGTSDVPAADDAAPSRLLASNPTATVADGRGNVMPDIEQTGRAAAAAGILMLVGTKGEWLLDPQADDGTVTNLPVLALLVLVATVGFGLLLVAVLGLQGHATPTRPARVGARLSVVGAGLLVAFGLTAWSPRSSRARPGRAPSSRSSSACCCSRWVRSPWALALRRGALSSARGLAVVGARRGRRVRPLSPSKPTPGTTSASR